MISEQWFDCDLAVVDVETTGFDARQERVIELAIIHMRRGEIIDTWSSLFELTDRPLPDEITRLTGITAAQLVGQPAFAERVSEIQQRLEGRVLVAYNLGFDRGFISAELERAGSVLSCEYQLDPLVFARELLRDLPRKRLGDVVQRLGITLEEAHRAKDDAIAAGRVLYALKEQLPSRLDALIALQATWSEQQEAMFEAQRRRRSGAAPAESAKPTPARAVGLSLGPAFVYGEETDPIRYFYRQLPDIGTRRQ